MWQLAAAVALVVAAGMAFLHFRQTPPPPQTFRYAISGPPDCTQIWAVALSPDGKSVAIVAVTSTKSGTGRREVFVRPFPSGEGEWQISIAGGQAARWRADGKEMFFVAPDGKIMAVPVNATAGAQPAFEAGDPVALFATTMLSNTLGSRPQYQYDVTADGSRFLIAHSVNTGPAPTPTLIVVTNWLAGLEK